MEGHELNLCDSGQVGLIWALMYLGIYVLGGGLYTHIGYRVFPGGKVRPGRDADPSPPSSAEVKNRVEL